MTASAPTATRRGPMRRRLRAVAGDGPLVALLILFGLNAVDELDRSAFAILAPEIRDEFGLGFAGLLTFIALVVAAALALTCMAPCGVIASTVIAER